jgi:hypothetical protein
MRKRSQTLCLDAQIQWATDTSVVWGLADPTQPLVEVRATDTNGDKFEVIEGDCSVSTSGHGRILASGGVTATFNVVLSDQGQASGQTTLAIPAELATTGSAGWNYMCPTNYKSIRKLLLNYYPKGSVNEHLVYAPILNIYLDLSAAMISTNDFTIEVETDEEMFRSMATVLYIDPGNSAVTQRFDIQLERLGHYDLSRYTNFFFRPGRAISAAAMGEAQDALMHHYHQQDPDLPDDVMLEQLGDVPVLATTSIFGSFKKLGRKLVKFGKSKTGKALINYGTKALIKAVASDARVIATCSDPPPELPPAPYDYEQGPKALKFALGKPSSQPAGLYPLPPSIVLGVDGGTVTCLYSTGAGGVWLAGPKNKAYHDLTSADLAAIEAAYSEAKASTSDPPEYSVEAPSVIRVEEEGKLVVKGVAPVTWTWAPSSGDAEAPTIEFLGGRANVAIFADGVSVPEEGWPPGIRQALNFVQARFVEQPKGFKRPQPVGLLTLSAQWLPEQASHTAALMLACLGSQTHFLVTGSADFRKGSKDSHGWSLPVLQVGDLRHKRLGSDKPLLYPGKSLLPRGLP